MPSFFVRRVGLALIPDGTESLNELMKLPTGKTLLVTTKQSRSLAHHRLFWALCSRMADALGVDTENISDVLKVATGHFTLVRTKSMGDLKMPKSISFTAMDQTKFKEFFDKCLEVIQTEWCVARSDLIDAIKDLLEETKK